MFIITPQCGIMRYPQITFIQCILSVYRVMLIRFVHIILSFFHYYITGNKSEKVFKLNDRRFLFLYFIL